LSGPPAKLLLTNESIAFHSAKRRPFFYDEEALLLDDPDHSEDEDRFILLGLSASLRVLLVVHSYRDEDATIRIISARKANARERSIYEKRRNR
jgi:uncharacterized DUF497 family protein